MASRVTELVTKLIATDKASKVIEHVADEMDRIPEKRDITLTATDKASDDVKALDSRLDGLSGKDKAIILRAQAKDAQKEIDRLSRSLRDVGKMDDETVKMRVEAIGSARAELEAIEREAEKLDREHVDVDVDADTTGIRGKFAQLKTDLSNASGGLGKLKTLGSTAFGALETYGPQALAVAGAAVATFVADAVSDFQTLALEVGKASDALGMSPEDVSRLKEVSEDLGISFDTVKSAIVRMNRVAETTPGLIEGIGASISRSDSGALNVKETFLSVAGALARIHDAGERAAAAQKILGKSWSQSAELIMKGEKGIREAMDSVAEGQIVTSEQVANAKALRDETDDLQDRLEGFKNSVAKEVTPILVQLADAAGVAADAFSAYFKVISGDFDVPVLNKLVRYGVPLIGTWNAVSDAVKGVKGELEDWAGVTHGTVDPAMQTLIDGAGGVQEAFDAIKMKDDPLGTMPEQWALLMDDMRDGKIDTQEAADAVNLLGGALGIAGDEVVGIAKAQLDKQMQDAAAAAQEYESAVAGVQGEMDAIQTSLDEWNTKVQTVGVSLTEALTPLEDGTAAAEAWAGAFEKIGAGRGLDTLQLLNDQRDAFRDVVQVVKDNKGVIPDAMDVGSKAASDLTDALSGLADTYGQDLQRTIEKSNGNFQAVRDRARELREDLRERFAVRLGVDLKDSASRDRVNELVNAVIPTDRQIRLGIKLAEDDLTKLKAQLSIEALQSLLPATALQLQVAMAEGDLSPEGAAATAEEALKQAGLSVDLGVDTKKADDTLVDFAATERDTEMGVVLTKGALSGVAGTIQAGPGGSGWPPIYVPVKPVLPPGYSSTYPGGPLTGPRSALPAAVTDESEMLGASTLAAPAALAPAPVARFSPFAAAAVVNYHVSVALNAGTIGAPYDVMRAVDASMRRAARLLPTRP